MLQSTLRLLPGPENLGTRLAMFLLAILLIGIVLLLLTGMDLAGLTPVDLGRTFAWIVLGANVLLLAAVGGLWRMTRREVLRPLEHLRRETLQAEGGGLGQVADTMRELRKAVSRAQADLEESNKNLRHVEKLSMVGKLAAGVAHSVRNPLTSVKLRLFSLERRLTLDPRSQEDFAVIADAIRHVDGIVGNFLEFSRRPRLRLEQLSPSGVVDAALRLMENRLANFPVSVILHRKTPLPEVRADPEQLCEALLNLLLNACEAMDYRGSLRITELLLNRRGGMFAAVRISDSGPGIAAEHLTDLFTAFFSTKEQGTGLGLPIAKGILEEHGGDIEVSSSPGSGACFTLLLPLDPIPEPLPRPRALKKPRADIAAPE